MAKKKLAKSNASYTWVDRPHPTGDKIAYKEISWPKPIPPGLPEFPIPTPTFPPTLPNLKPVREQPVTKFVTIIPKVLIDPMSGRGHAISVDGFRMINIYVISDPVNSTYDRAFMMDVYFAPYATQGQYGPIFHGLTSNVYNFDSQSYPSGFEAKHYRLRTSDRDVNNQLPQAGGFDLAHCMRVPVIGPYVRVIASNLGNASRSVEVVAYLVS
ncbi:MAG TPA: hypothetical protein PKE26_02020 [Kiritimatiellia bacterium]|nr:hypothetical protein [Kiritimatiellia bacterium]HMO51440.1 hypothetical protein [Kiritimatiellia bacterium]HMO97865.1 hypothetical protein [Kiritimatiellia bacterium]HMP97297.1 hypothetical protein [Kiritimatiellia bacterium]